LYCSETLNELIAKVEEDPAGEALVTEAHGHVNAGVVELADDAQHRGLLARKTLLKSAYLQDRHDDEDETQQLLQEEHKVPVPEVVEDPVV
jgi:hypothetical protein